MLALAVAVGAPARAEPPLSVQGQRAAVSPIDRPARIEYLRSEHAPRVSRHELRLADVSPQEVEAALGSRDSGPTVIGFPRRLGQGAAFDLRSSLSWHALAGGQIAVLTISSPGAAALRLGLEVVDLPAGAELRFFGADDSDTRAVSGAQVLDTVDRNLKAGDTGIGAVTYWSPVIEGESIGLEIYLPPGAAPDGVRATAAAVSHLVDSPRLRGRLQSSAASPLAASSCFRDVTCDPALSPTQEAVARMIFTTQAGLSKSCTGTLLNDSAGSLTPYFLTAGHCISTQSVASTLHTYWYYNSSACDSGLPDGGYVVRNGGADLLWPGDLHFDVALLRLREHAPEGTLLSGWNAAWPADPKAPVIGIHHPLGGLKKFSIGSVPYLVDCGIDAASEKISCENVDNDGDSYLVYWNAGTTDHGSSGSGLFSGKVGSADWLQLFGVLSGGSASCGNPGGTAYYTRFDRSFAQGNLGRWLAQGGGPYGLTVLKSLTNSGAGAGTVISVPAGINCGVDCAATYPAGTLVTLVAAPAPGSQFLGWSGECAGYTGDCQVVMDKARSVSASFVVDPSGIALSNGQTVSGLDGPPGAARYYHIDVPPGAANLVVRTLGGFGNVDLFLRHGSPPNTIDDDCRSTTSGSSEQCQIAVPSAGRWVLMLRGATTYVNVNLQVSYTVNGSQLLTIAKAGSGSGTVRSSGQAGIVCGPDCSEYYVAGASVTLTATPADGSTFAGWSGPCSGTGTCVVGISLSTTVTATFVAGPVSATPLANGQMIANVSGPMDGMRHFYIDVPAGASSLNITGGNYDAYMYVRFGSPALVDSPFDCSPTIYNYQRCDFNAPSAGRWYVMVYGALPFVTSVQATYGFPLSVTFAGPGRGTVHGDGLGNGVGRCSANCMANYASSTTVTLTAAPYAGSTFTGWSGGGCSGTGSCVVNVTQAIDVTATFGVQEPTMLANGQTVANLSGGYQSVRYYAIDVPPGATNLVVQSLPGTAERPEILVNHGSPPVADVPPDGGYSFPVPFDCAAPGSPNGRCMYTTPAAGRWYVMVWGGTSIFSGWGFKVSYVAPTSQTLAVTRIGTGSGSVTSNPAGVSCGGDCSEAYAPGTSVTLAAVPDPGTTFIGWSGGGCTGTGPCVVGMTETRNVVAKFYVITPLVAGQPVDNVTGANDSLRYFYLDVPPGATNLVIETSAGTGDVDLYVRNGDFPTTESYDCAPFEGGNAERCTFAAPRPGRHYVLLHGYMPYAGVTLLASYAAGPSYSLTASKGGKGAGTITSNPAGIRCGDDCSEAYVPGTQVNLLATPAAGSVFAGWTGACAGLASCTVTLSGARDVSALYTSANAASANANEWVQKSYVAYYGRPADPAGLSYWASRMDQEGGSLASVIEAFGTSDEFSRRYGGLDHTALVTKIYWQTLGRGPDPAGLSWYVGELQAGRRTLQSITLDVLNGATTAPDSTTVANKLDVANHYTGKVSLGCAYGGEPTGVASLAPVTFDAATGWAAKVAIESRCGP
jgi:hypothetical protein